MERAAVTLLGMGAVLFLAFVLRSDFPSLTLDYLGLIVGILMVSVGLGMLHRCEMKRRVIK